MVSNLIHSYVKLTTLLSKAVNSIAAIAVVLMVVVVAGNVIMRLFDMPVYGAYDIAGFLMVVSIGLSVPYCAVRNGHIAVDMFIRKCPQNWQNRIDLVTGIVCVVFTGLIALQLVRYGHQIQLAGRVTQTTRTPIYPFIYTTAAGFGAFCLVELGKVFLLLKADGGEP